MTTGKQSPARPLAATLLGLIAGVAAVAGIVHATAWLAAPRGLGFNPHPWFLAAPADVKEFIQAVGLPTTNLGVVSTFFLFLPAYILVVVGCLWLSRRLR